MIRHPVYGGASAVFGDCPEVVGPPGETCTDTFILVAETSWLFEGGSAGPNAAPWGIVLETYQYVFNGTAEPDVVPLRWGYAPSEVSADLQRLAAAADPLERPATLSIDVSVPMSDGSVDQFSGEWTSLSTGWRDGRDGPTTINGAPHHYVDRCTTVNAISHQVGRPATMVGTMNGESISSYPDAGGAAVFKNRFMLIEAPHGGMACT